MSNVDQFHVVGENTRLASPSNSHTRRWLKTLLIVFALIVGMIPFQTLVPALAGHGGQEPTHLNGEPETDTNPVGTSHSFTATVTVTTGVPAVGQQVRFEFVGANDPDGDGFNTATADESCSTGASGDCSISVFGASAGTLTVTAWVDDAIVSGTDDMDETETQTVTPDDADDTDTWVKVWVPLSDDDAILNVAPETDSNPAGTTHAMLATVTAQDGNRISGTTVDFEYAGANDPDGNGDTTSPEDTCTTNVNGTCTVTFGDSDGVGASETAEDAGTTTVTAWVDADGSTPTSEANSEGQVDPEDDDTDVVLKGWVAADAAVLDVEPESDLNTSGSDHILTATVTDEFGNPVEGSIVDFEYTGANDPDADSDETTVEDTCTTTDAGTCTVTLGDDDPDGDPEGTGEAGTTTVIGWIDEDDDDSTSEADTAETPTADDEDNTDVVRKSWELGDATILDIGPETGQNEVGSSHDITALVTDEFGNPISGTAVDFEFEGANDPDDNSTQTSTDDTCTTDQNGECSVTLGPGTTTEAGTTTVTAWIDSDVSDTTSEANSESLEDPEDDDTDVAAKGWTAGPASVLDVEPETDQNSIGSKHRLNALVTDDFGNPVSGTPVDFEYVGKNDPDNGPTQTTVEDTCTTGENGRCSVVLGDDDSLGVTETTTAEGTTTATGWIDANGTDTVSEADNEPPNDPENDDTDVVLKGWVSGFEVAVPEGATHSGFHTFVLIANPNSITATVDVAFLTPSGALEPISVQNLEVPPGSRRTIDVNAVLAPAQVDVGTKVSSDVQVTAEAAVHKEGSLAEMIMSAQPAQDSWLMAEGATHSGFTTFVTIANPDTTTETVVDVTFFRPGGVTSTAGVEDIVIPAGSRHTINVNTALGAADDVSTLVEVDSGPPVVAGRSLHKVDSGGDLGIGGSVGSLGSAKAHVVAEGATHSDWHTFVLVFSQGPSVINVDYMTPGGVVQGDQNVPVDGRFTIDVNAELPSATDVATLIEVVSGTAVAVEGTVQKIDGTGFVIADSVSSSGSTVANATAADWIVAEGASHSGFTTFILIANPNDTSAVVDVTFLTKGSGPVNGPQDLVIPALGRATVSVNLFVSDDVSTLVAAETGTVVVEMAIDRVSNGFSKGRSLAFEL